MKIKLTKTDIEFLMFADYWKMMEEYYEPEDNDKYWEDVVNAARNFISKYNTTYAKNLVFSLIEELERKYNEKNSQNN